MKRKAVSGVFLALLLLGSLTLVFNVQTAETLESPPAEWTRTYGGAYLDVANSIVETTDKGYALAGYSFVGVPNQYKKFWLVKVDSSGNHQWNKTYGRAINDIANSIVETSDGGYALAGQTGNYESSDFWLVKVDSSGNHQWNKTYGRAINDIANSIVETSDGGYALAGQTDTLLAPSDAWLVKVDSSGNLRWNQTYGGPGEDIAYSVMETGDGGFVYAGVTYSLGTDYDGWLVKVDAYGIMQWNKTYGGLDSDYAFSLVETIDGGYALAGYTDSYGAGNHDAWLVKVDGDGTMRWNKTYGGVANDVVLSAVRTIDEGYALAGSTNSFGAGGSDFWLVKVDMFGTMQWNKKWGGINDDAAQALVETIDGGYALAGYTDSYRGGNRDAWLVKVAGAERPPTRYPWSMFHHNLGHTGYSRSPAPNTNQTLWNYTTGAYVSSSPAVAYGKVYVGSTDNKIYCLDASTGMYIWNYTTGGEVRSSPAVADGKVYVGSMNNKLYCLDATTGVQIWNYTTGTIVESSPAVAYGMVYVGSYDRNVYCLDAATGVLIWNYTTGGEVRSSPAVADGKVYVGSMNNKLYCLDATTGVQIWNYTTKNSQVQSSPAVADGKVYFGSIDGKVYCLDASTGTKIWNYTTGSNVVSSPAVAYGMVYVGSYDDYLYCLNATTGAYIWGYPTGNFVWSSPAVADGKVYFGSMDGKVYCLDAVTGAHIWSYTAGGWVESSPAVADGVVFIGGGDKVYAFGNVIRVPEDYLTIQQAIDAATVGATISIAVDTYNETLVVNKTLTLLGRKGSTPIFEGGGSGVAVTLLSGASGSIVTGIVITNYDQGILIQGASECVIYDNIMSLMSDSGISAEGTSAANNQIYSNIFQSNPTAIDLTEVSTSNSIYDNTISSNIIGLNLAESSGNTIYTNTVSQNEVGINMSNSNDNTIYHNNFVNNLDNAMSHESSNVWDNGYPSGGNYWSDYNGTDANLDGIGDTAYVIDTNNTDDYPLMNPWVPPDIAVVNLTPSKNVVGEGFSLQITATVLNQGNKIEIFETIVYGNTTFVASQNVTLASGNLTIVTFTWNTTGFAKGNYAINVAVTPVQDEADTSDNTYTDGWIFVTIVGDVDGDRDVDVGDQRKVQLAMFSVPGAPNWNPNMDIDSDLDVDVGDQRKQQLNMFNSW